MSMDTWDVGTWDDLARAWDGQAAAAQLWRLKMLRLKLGIARLPRETQHSKMLAVHTGLSDQNVNPVFLNPSPSLATYKTKLDVINTKLGKIANLREQIDQILMQLDDTDLPLARMDYETLGGFVVNKAAGNASLVPPTGFELAADSAPLGALVQVSNLAVTTGDHEGELDAGWNATPGANAYEIHIADNPNGTWSFVTVSGTSKFTLTALPSLTKKWVRVRAIRGNEKGPWSDPACGMVP